jgi:hypothetical protein
MDETFSIERPVEYGSYSFLPIVLNTANGTPATYLNAAEAIEDGSLLISEVGDDVESILAKNLGSKPILIEAAEILRGDNTQDRIVLQSILLQPGKESRIPVKCVHAPHYLRGGAGFSSMGASGEALRKKIHLRKYASIMTDVDHYTPAAAMDQREVWDDVEGYVDGENESDQTKYTEALDRKRKELSNAAEQIRGLMPKDTVGVIVIQRESGIQAFELYRSGNAFQKRAGFIESLLMDKSITDSWPLEGEAAWATGIQLIYKMRDVTDEEVIVQEGSSNLHIGIDDLVGEAITGTTDDNTHHILYCTLSPSS